MGETTTTDGKKTYKCLVDQACTFEGSWLEVQEHAQDHPLPHPDDRPAWLASRRSFIGASEIPAVLGLLAPYRSALDVWAAKCLPMEKEQPMVGRRRIGLVLEPALLDDFGRRHNCTVYRPATRRHPLLPFVGASPDGIVIRCGQQTDEGVQVKVVGHNSAAAWEDGPPAYVQAQVQIEMEVFGLQRSTVLALIDTDEPQEYVVERDPAMFDPIAELASDFWVKYVLTREPPADLDQVPTSEALARVFPRAVGPLAVATPAEVDLIIHYIAAREAIEKAKTMQEELSASLKFAIGDRAGVEATGSDNHRLKATWKNRAPSPNWRAVAEDALALLDPEKHDPSEVIRRNTPAEGPRVLDVRVK